MNTKTEAPAGAATVTLLRLTNPPAEQLNEWDELVSQVGGTDVTQLSAWGRIRGLAGYTPEYLLAYSGGRLAGGALLLRRRLMPLVELGYLPYGPLVSPDTADPGAVTAALLDQLTRVARSLMATFVQPPEGAPEMTTGLLARGFRPSRAGIAPLGSYRVDLTRPLEEIRGGFSKRLKSWTNRWAAKGVHVRLGDERDLPLLADLMAYTGARQGFTPPPLEYMRRMYRELAPHGHAAVFVGEVDGRPVSADLVTVVGGMIRGRLGGFDGSGATGKLSVPAAVRWEIIKWGQRQGHRWLDFGGLPEQMLTDMIDRGMHTSDEWPSAQRAKLAFNGTPFRYPAPVELIRPWPAKVGYDLLRRSATGKKLLGTAKVKLRGQFRRG
ncbi:hypothetical protein GCM10023321_03490 [Pseudonocardia eucalypti]|uniref:BioF2-like acetyltransferase domain-containing protein n=1 Tax=Pseudonocardia eucalypti TaxID=648755 RepID=A0ABP9PFA1_9PSEU|nr:lipid II:glycine glycyltransferase (peptidoglycan interpeptide bridge formation enzyme) [Pseudonocardia eucalypti]